MTACLSASITLMSVLMYLLAASGISFPMQLELAIAIACCTLFPFLLDRTGASVTPARLFAVSVGVFLLARPLLYLLLGLPMVEAGNSPQAIMLVATIAIIGSFSGSAAIAFNLPFHRFASVLVSSRLRIAVPEVLAWLLFLVAVFLLAWFFLDSIIAFSVLRSHSNYFDALNDPKLHAHIPLFFRGKMLLILSVALMPKRDLFLFSSVMLALASVGFLLVGLRGYFVIYLAVAVFFITERYRINLVFVVGLGALVLLGAGLFLQYRIGAQLFSGPIDGLLATLHSQGATFEVAYGAVAFSAQLTQCVSLLEYLSGAKSVGVCIDSVRNIGFASGGFGTSIVAELYFVSFPALLIVAFLVGIAIRVLQDLSSFRLRHSSFTAGLVLIMTIPNLFYIGRSDAADFVTNFAVACAFTLLFYRKDRSLMRGLQPGP